MYSPVSLDELSLSILLLDRTHTSENETHNIIWATDDYSEIQLKSVVEAGSRGLCPRVGKSREEQERRSRDMAEVFTPAWICNAQNNLVDAAWFGLNESPFNKEKDNGWETKNALIPFPTESGRTWQDYVLDPRLEMACGEAPYLVSRYDAISGETIPVRDRIGLFDRKLRVVGENAHDEKEWDHWALEACKSIYGFEWQGDNLFLARESMLFTYIDHRQAAFGALPRESQIHKMAEVISWNLWQMDGLKGVIPGSCHDFVEEIPTLFGEPERVVTQCKGCSDDDMFRHNGTYCRIKDWKTGKTIRFIDLIKP